MLRQSTKPPPPKKLPEDFPADASLPPWPEGQRHANSAKALRLQFEFQTYDLGRLTGGTSPSLGSFITSNSPQDAVFPHLSYLSSGSPTADTLSLLRTDPNPNMMINHGC